MKITSLKVYSFWDQLPGQCSLWKHVRYPQTPRCRVNVQGLSTRQAQVDLVLCLQIYDDNGGLVKQWVNKPRNWPATLPVSSLQGGGVYKHNHNLADALLSHQCLLTMILPLFVEMWTNGWLYKSSYLWVDLQLFQETAKNALLLEQNNCQNPQCLAL